MAMVGLSAPVYADGAGWFLGGVVASPLLGDVRRQTEAAEVQAASTAQLAQDASTPPAYSGAAQTSSVEAKLNTLDTPLAKGYITKQEYDVRKKAILDSI